MRTPFAVVLFAVALCGCDRTHLSPNFGVAERVAFHAQVIHPDAGDEMKPDQPLDPEEAAGVVKKYKRSLSPGGEQGGTGGQLLMVPSGAMSPPSPTVP